MHQDPGTEGLCHREPPPWLCIPLVLLTWISLFTSSTFCTAGGSHRFVFTCSMLAALQLLLVAKTRLVPRAGSHLRTLSGCVPAAAESQPGGGMPSGHLPTRAGWWLGHCRNDALDTASFPAAAEGRCLQPLLWNRSVLVPTT